MKANVYLHFNGNCEEAINYYADILGGNIVMQMRFKDAPEEICKNFPEQIHNLIMHTTLEADGVTILASDHADEHEALQQGNNYAIALNLDDEEQATAIFNGFTEEGTVMMPFEEAFWGGKFGMLVDKFGIRWMVSLNDPSKHQV